MDIKKLRNTVNYGAFVSSMGVFLAEKAYEKLTKKDQERYNTLDRIPKRTTEEFKEFVDLRSKLESKYKRLQRTGLVAGVALGSFIGNKVDLSSGSIALDSAVLAISLSTLSAYLKGDNYKEAKELNSKIENLELKKSRSLDEMKKLAQYRREAAGIVSDGMLKNSMKITGAIASVAISADKVFSSNPEKIWNFDTEKMSQDAKWDKEDRARNTIVGGTLGGIVGYQTGKLINNQRHLNKARKLKRQLNKEELKKKRIKERLIKSGTTLVGVGLGAYLGNRRPVNNLKPMKNYMSPGNRTTSNSDNPYHSSPGGYSKIADKIRDRNLKKSLKTIDISYSDFLSANLVSTSRFLDSEVLPTLVYSDLEVLKSKLKSRFPIEIPQDVPIYAKQFQGLVYVGVLNREASESVLGMTPSDSYRVGIISGRLRRMFLENNNLIKIN